MAGLRDRYGDGPLHLIAVVVSFAVIGYALVEVLGGAGPLSFILFFAGAIVAHDLIAFPIYSGLDRLAGGGAARVGLGPATINYVRVPGLLSALAMIVWFPLILALDPGNYELSTGRQPPDYLARWMALTAILFLTSGLVYAIRRRRSGRDRDRATDPRDPRTPR